MPSSSVGLDRGLGCCTHTPHSRLGQEKFPGGSFAKESSEGLALLLFFSRFFPPPPKKKSPSSGSSSPVQSSPSLPPSRVPASTGDPTTGELGLLRLLLWRRVALARPGRCCFEPPPPGRVATWPAGDKAGTRRGRPSWRQADWNTHTQVEVWGGRVCGACKTGKAGGGGREQQRRRLDGGARLCWQPNGRGKGSPPPRVGSSGRKQQQRARRSARGAGGGAFTNRGRLRWRRKDSGPELSPRPRPAEEGTYFRVILV